MRIETEPADQTTTARRRRVVALMTALLFAVAAGPATATPEQAAAQTDVVPFGVFAEGEEMTLVGGPLFEQGCLGEGFTETLLRYRDAPSGVYTETVVQDDENIFLIEGLLDDAIAAACEAIDAGQPSPVEVLAQGRGRTMHQFRIRDDVARTLSTITGTLTFPDGTTARVTAHETVVLTFTDDGGVEVESITGKVIVH